jgi:hypothetical protein
LGSGVVGFGCEVRGGYDEVCIVFSDTSDDRLDEVNVFEGVFLSGGGVRDSDEGSRAFHRVPDPSCVVCEGPSEVLDVNSVDSRESFVRGRGELRGWDGEAIDKGVLGLGEWLFGLVVGLCGGGRFIFRGGYGVWFRLGMVGVGGVTEEGGAFSIVDVVDGWLLGDLRVGVVLFCVFSCSLCGLFLWLGVIVWVGGRLGRLLFRSFLWGGSGL